MYGFPWFSVLFSRGSVNVLGYVLLFLLYSKCMGFLCAYQSKFIRFGFAVLLLVSLKRNSTRIARKVFSFSLLRI